MKELIEEGIDHSEQLKRVEEMIFVSEPEPTKPTRKPRKDKGIPKPKPVPPGTLTIEQVQKLRSLMDAVIRTRDARDKADMALDDANTIYEDYLTSLTRAK